MPRILQQIVIVILVNLTQQIYKANILVIDNTTEITIQTRYKYVDTFLSKSTHNVITKTPIQVRSDIPTVPIVNTGRITTKYYQL